MTFADLKGKSSSNTTYCKIYDKFFHRYIDMITWLCFYKSKDGKLTIMYSKIIQSLSIQN